MIRVNGKTEDVAQGMTIRQLIARLGYEQKNVAVAVNRAFVPRSMHDTCVLKEHDEVDIVAPMQGG